MPRTPAQRPKAIVVKQVGATLPKAAGIPEAPSPREIRLWGVRQNNLKNFDLNLPLGKWIVITGLSGSGKSSLAFETLYAEGQRRYIETFTPYARQFFDRMDKPAVDRIENIPPAIAIEQRNAVRTTRSTVGTMTEICDYMKMVWPHLSQLHCRHCSQPVRRESPQLIWESLSLDSQAAGAEALITFELPLSEKLGLDEQIALLNQQGFQRLLLDKRAVRIDEAMALLSPVPARLVVITDRVRLSLSNRARFVEACEQAYAFGRGHLRFIFWRVRPRGRDGVSVPVFTAPNARWTIANRRRRSSPSIIPRGPAPPVEVSDELFPLIRRWPFQTPARRSRKGPFARGRPA